MLCNPNLLSLFLIIFFNTQTIPIVLATISNILDCFSVDRFVPIDTEQELENVADQLNNKKLFYAGIYFTDSNITDSKDISYKLRMDIDNTPITVRNRNQYWFPGPEASFSENMRYHRGFIELQHAVDSAIIKSVKNMNNKMSKDTIDTIATTTSEPATDAPSLLNFEWFKNENETEEVEVGTLEPDVEDFLNFDDEEPANKTRTKRSPQFNFLSLLGGGSSSSALSDDDDDDVKFNIDDLKFYTKMFPYPKYRDDQFKSGLYMSQAIQMTFFVALIVQIAAAVRQRIWLKESGNRRLMRAMGLNKSSDLIAWIITTIIEISIINGLCSAILFISTAIQTTNFFFFFSYLTLFGLCIVAFW